MTPRAVLPLALAAALAGCGDQPAALARMEAAIAERLDRDAAALTAPAPGAPLPAGFAPALRAAIERDPGYLAARGLEAEALAAVDGVAAAWRPQVAGNATLGGLREGDPVSETTFGAAGDLTLSQLVYDGGETRGGVTRARAQAIAAGAAAAERGNTLALEAARVWIDLWQAEERLSLLEAKTAGLGDILDRIERMAETGLLDRTARDATLRQIADLDLTRTDVEARRAEARIRFARVFGSVPPELPPPEELITAAGARTLSADWRAAPALIRAVAELEAAKGAEAEARAGRKPRVALQAGVASPMEEDEAVDLSAGLRVSYVFGDGGRRKARIAAAAERVAALDLQVTEAGTRAAAEIEVALERLAAIERAAPVVARKAALAAAEAETARSQIVTGQASLRQLVEAEIESYRAEDRRIQMEGERLVLQMSMAAQVGALASVVGLVP